MSTSQVIMIRTQDTVAHCQSHNHPHQTPSSSSSPQASDTIQVLAPVSVVDAPDLKITEYFGNVASKTPALSACICEVHKATQEAYQTPEFDEFVIVLEGIVELQYEGGTVKVAAGQGALLKAGTRVKWIWPGSPQVRANPAPSPKP